ncbi:sulfate transport system permease protein CysW [Oxobacter pfennigii]|uniref:Sulfate transport system permease protein CysW n=1 Tax=Oxobacter pfennigii TaxID=36849 RepID=A0A0P8Y8A5_9CLOT|nr:ABC transporter permease [Oxobacter pfennigii]KPU42914.1 sulfate transport system permease protein CysW [Oxobacter pfennigii]
MKRKSTLNLFDITAIIIAAAIAFFIISALLTIVLGGAPYLKKALLSDEIRHAILLSIYTASVSTVICVILAVPAAYALTRTSLPFKKTLQIIIELPLSLPYLVLGLCLLIVFSSDFGRALKDLGLKVVFDKNGIIMAQIFVNLPFAVHLMRAAIDLVDARLEFIAGSLGASRLERFTTITLPLCLSSVLMMVILVWSRALGEFGATLMLVGVTRMKTETLPASIYLNISTGDNGMAMAAAIIILIIAAVSLTITTVLRKYTGIKSRISEVVL